MEDMHGSSAEQSPTNEEDQRTTGLGVVQKSAFSTELQQELLAHRADLWGLRLTREIFGSMIPLIDGREECEMIARILEVVPYKDLPRGGTPYQDNVDSPSGIWLLCEAKALLGKPVVDDQDRAVLHKLLGPENDRDMQDFMTARPYIGDRTQLLIGESKENSKLRSAELISFFSNGLVWEETWKFDPAKSDRGKTFAVNINTVSRENLAGTDQGTVLLEMNEDRFSSGHLKESVWIP